MAVASIVDALPDNFKVVVDSTQSNPLQQYELNTLLLTAYLLDTANANATYQNTVADFARTMRFNDTILNDQSILQPELYKGYLAFKSTAYDLYYYLRQAGLDTTVIELAPSGLLDLGVATRVLDGTWTINPNNANPGTLIQLANIANDPSLMNNSCEIALQVTVNIDGDGDTQNSLSVAYNQISQLLLNRLPCYTVLQSITFIINITNNFDFDEVEDDGGSFYILVQQFQDQVETTQLINNAVPLLIQPGGFQLNGYTISDVYQIAGNSNSKEVNTGNGFPNRIWDKGTSEWDGGTTDWTS